MVGRNNFIIEQLSLVKLNYLLPKNREILASNDVAGNLLKACFDVRLIYGLPSFLTHVVGSATVCFNNSWSLG